MVELLLSQIKNKTIWRQFSRFIMTGVVNTLIDLALYYFLTRHVAFFGRHYSTSKAVTFLAATAFSFVVNRYWTFGNEEKINWKELLKFYLAIGSGIFINVGVHYLVSDTLGLSDILAVLVAAGFTAIWGFSFSKFWVFKK